MGNQWRGIDKTDTTITRGVLSFPAIFLQQRTMPRDISTAMTLTKSNVSGIFSENL
jgi:hypothetical protein